MGSVFIPPIQLPAVLKRTSCTPFPWNLVHLCRGILCSFSWNNQYIGYKITFDRFDAVFYEQFVRYLTFDFPLMRRTILLKGLKVNTVGKTIKQLKTFIKDRIQKKVIPY